MSGWQPINSAPDDWQRPGGQRQLRLRDGKTGEEAIGRRTLWNNSGWAETGTNRELWPTHWKPAGENGQA